MPPLQFVQMAYISAGKVNSGMRQFRNLLNFAGCGNFAVLLSASSLLMVSASLFFWILTCSSEFNSDFLGFAMIELTRKLWHD